jgi:hypothetical protein
MTVIKLRVTTDVFDKTTLSDQIVAAFEWIGVTVTTKCRLSHEQPHMVVTLLGISLELFQLLLLIEKSGVAPLMYNGNVYILRFHEV